MLQDDEVHISYCLTGSLNPRRLDELVAALSGDERARYERFRQARDRRDFAAAHALLRRTLSKCDNVPEAAWVFTTNAFGKPSIAAAGDDPRARSRISFSIAHTEGLVACAVARGVDLGVDVESVGRVAGGRDLASRYFSEREVAALDVCPESEHDVRFIELWTLKEAYLKAIGVGFSHPLNTVAFVFEGPSHLRFEPAPDIDPAGWQFALFVPSDHHRMAVAIKCDPRGERRITTRAEGASSSESYLLRVSRA
jgi:4'-phosphopantetheinyl transferase